MSEAQNLRGHDLFSDPSTNSRSDAQSDFRSELAQSPKTVLLVEDCSIDRELYRRYLLRNAEQSYQILEADCGETALDLCRLPLDVVLLDHCLPDFDGLEFLQALQAHILDPPPVIVITGQGNESIAVQLLKAGAENYLVKGRLSAEELQYAIDSAIEKARLQRRICRIEAERQQYLERERIINQISQQVLRSLDLEQILQTTVQEVQQFLQADRVLIFAFAPNLESGEVVAEVAVPPWTAVLTSTFRDPCFHRDYAESYRQGRVMAVADIQAAGLNLCHQEFLESLQVRANLVVPILQRKTLWGLLIAQHCATPRDWRKTDIELLQQLATQVGIALQQADDYRQLAAQNTQLQSLNEELQVTLQELQLAQAEREQLLHQEQVARTEAERANRVKDEFLAVLSHELRSPLNPILGWVTLLQTQTLSPEKTKAALEAIDRNAKLQAQLIEDLLDISRIIRGKLTLNAAPVDLASVLQAALETVQLAASAKSIQLDLAIVPPTNSKTTPFQPAYVSGDATRLQQVFWNLLSNAIKFTPNGGRVEVRVEQVRGLGTGDWAKGEWGSEGAGERGSRGSAESTENLGRMGSMSAGGTVDEPASPPSPLIPLSPPPLLPLSPPPLLPFAQLTITDTGKGIHPDFLPYVFDYFRQEDASTTRKFGGLGLGLSIARQIVELHGGTIAVASPGEGAGATFTVRLPLMGSRGAGEQGSRGAEEQGSGGAGEQSSQYQPPSPTAPQPPTAPLSGIRVLVVDDEPDTRAFLTFLLQEGGAAVTEAACAAKVLQTMEQFSPDVIVSDIGMPEMDGYMLMKTLRASQQTRSIPAIALTAYASESDQQQAIAAGFQRHATKPIDPSQVIALILELVQPK